MTRLLLALAFLPAFLSAQKIYLSRWESNGTANGISQIFTLEPAASCQEKLLCDNLPIFNLTDIAFHPNGKIYGLGLLKLFEIDPATCATTEILDFQNAFFSFSMTTAPDGRLFFITTDARLGAFDLTNLSVEFFGKIEIDGAVILNINNDLVFVGSRAFTTIYTNSLPLYRLVEINLADPSKSQIVMPLATPTAFGGLIGRGDCRGPIFTGFNLGSGGSGPFDVREIDLVAQTEKVICQTATDFFGAAREGEEKKDTAQIDPTFLVNETTCDATKIGSSDTLFLTDFRGCDSLVIRKFVDGRDSVFLKKSICAGDFFEFDGQKLTASGLFSAVFKNQKGCDSTVVLDLKRLEKDSIFIETTTCDPSESGTTVQKLTNFLGCDSTIVEKKRLRLGDDLTVVLDSIFEIRIGDTAFLEPIFNFRPAEIEWILGGKMICAGCEILSLPLDYDQKVRGTATDSMGCQVRFEALIRVDPTQNLFVPTVFSPDDDGLNDVFSAFGDQTFERILSLRVIDRWGDVLFDGRDLAFGEGWDGSGRGGKKAATGLYVFELKTKMRGGREGFFRGGVSLVR